MMKLTPENIIMDLIDKGEYFILGLLIGAIFVGLMIYANNLAEQKRLAKDIKDKEIKENTPDWMSHEEAIKLNDIE